MAVTGASGSVVDRATRAALGESQCCDRCGHKQSPAELKWDAVIHHGAREIVCVDRKACERIRRKERSDV